MPRARWRTPLIVGASLAIHAAVLGPLALGSLGIDVVPLWDGPHPHWPDPIDVILVRPPTLPGSPPRGRDTLRPDRHLFGPPVTEAGPAAKDARFRGGPVAPSEPATDARSASSQQGPPNPSDIPTDRPSDAWRAGADRLAAGAKQTGLDCRRPEILPPIEREACARRFAVADATAATDRLGQRRLTRTESVREDGFAEQAAANEAWARYRRSEDEGSYPGLRSMLKHF